jgi:hypothetical protein
MSTLLILAQLAVLFKMTNNQINNIKDPYEGMMKGVTLLLSILNLLFSRCNEYYIKIFYN